ncbi:hypothetical protein, partial [Pantoea ananatis]|uniref:hypothetical protein n=1 Tax=Pantoea ananas TaxID=553 RepID=UPI001B3140D3
GTVCGITVAPCEMLSFSQGEVCHKRTWCKHEAGIIRMAEPASWELKFCSDLFAPRIRPLSSSLLSLK